MRAEFQLSVVNTNVLVLSTPAVPPVTLLIKPSVGSEDNIVIVTLSFEGSLDRRTVKVWVMTPFSSVSPLAWET